MSVGCSATVSVTAGGGLTYLWSVTNGTITGGQGTTSITFTANTNPVTVKITETNASSCSASDFATITVNTSPPVPANMDAIATSSTSVAVSWTGSPCATSYEVARTTSTNATVFSIIGSPTTTSFTDTASANAAYLYEVRAVGGSSSRSAYSSPDLATTVIFTDDPLVATTTGIKLVHVTELRTAVQAVRTLASLSAFSFTDPTPATSTPVKAVHVSELRIALDAARAALALSPLTYTDPTITPGVTAVKAAHFQEIRTGVK